MCSVPTHQPRLQKMKRVIISTVTGAHENIPRRIALDWLKFLKKFHERQGISHWRGCRKGDEENSLSVLGIGSDSRTAHHAVPRNATPRHCDTYRASHTPQFLKQYPFVLANLPIAQGIPSRERTTMRRQPARATARGGASETELEST